VTPTDLLFPLADYWWFYAVFTFGVLAVLAIDLGLFHRDAHAVSFRESLLWSIVWVSLALAFNYGLYLHALARFPADVAEQIGLEFLAGYLVEKSLAVDNVFVFVLVFSYFAVPLKYQHRVLFYGIIGALVFRALFIALGSVLMQYQAVVLIFGAVLVASGIRMLFARNKTVDPGTNPFIRLFQRFVPVTRDFHGQRFFVRLSGVWHATPLFIALLFLELSDVIFAVDSVPAIFALTREPFIVFTSNVCAILGLRAMYFLLAGAVERFHLLQYGLALILVFVGLKMVWLNDAFGGKFPIEWSLGIITALLVSAVIASLLWPASRAASRPDGAPAGSNAERPAQGAG
jgi:tellurite resistance protein TerC